MLKQRWGWSSTPNGFLDVSVDDITFNLTDKAKRNILTACNECSLMGYNNNIEYATMLDAITGEPIKGHRLIEGSEDSVDLSEWLNELTTAESRSKILVHNHTNKTFFSLDDIELLLKFDSIASELVVSEKHIYYVKKLDYLKRRPDAFKKALREIVNHKGNVFTKGKVVEKRLYDYFLKASNMCGLEMGRW